jgi:hypothetical protein
MAWRFSGRCQALSCLTPEIIEVKWLRRATGFAVVPQLPQSLEIFLPQLMFELPVADGLTDDFADGRIQSELLSPNPLVQPLSSLLTDRTHAHNHITGLHGYVGFGWWGGCR